MSVEIVYGLVLITHWNSEKNGVVEVFLTKDERCVPVYDVVEPFFLLTFPRGISQSKNKRFFIYFFSF